MAKYLIIFGAGASFGSDTSNKPPLGGDLFLELQRFDSDSWGKISGELVTEFKSDFEKAMSSLFVLDAYQIIPLQGTMASYFFQFQPTPNSLYHELAQLIAKQTWDGALVTFNYERLLEIALNKTRIWPFPNIKPDRDDYRKSIELCVPHGICNIFCSAISGGKNMLWDASSVTTRGHVELVTEQTEFDRRIKEHALPPVMSYFEPSKRTTSGGNFIEEQRKKFSDLVNRADKIAIIGLRVREHDKHIWMPLSNTNAKLIYCSGKSAGEEFKIWSEKKRAKKDDSVLYSYFQKENWQGFNEIMKYIGLKNDL